MRTFTAILIGAIVLGVTTAFVTLVANCPAVGGYIAIVSLGLFGAWGIGDAFLDEWGRRK